MTHGTSANLRPVRKVALEPLAELFEESSASQFEIRHSPRVG